jgi:hypothetical protein
MESTMYKTIKNKDIPLRKREGKTKEKTMKMMKYLRERSLRSNRKSMKIVKRLDKRNVFYPTYWEQQEDEKVDDELFRMAMESVEKE